MLLSLLFYRVFAVLLPPCLLSLAYLYAYPLVHQCGFPETTHRHKSARAGVLQQPKSWAKKWRGAGERAAPFRLLAFGDPQLEGDSSIPPILHVRLPSIDEIRARDARAVKESWESLTMALRYRVEGVRKTIDLWGNDWYLAHIYRSMHWWTRPTHVTVLGDLLGSQWVSDEEFSRRSARYWTRAFRGATRVEEELMSSRPGKTEVLGADEAWKTRLINIVGNHDVGYAGDLDESRIERFERSFGRANWDVRFLLPNSSSSGAAEEEADHSLPSIRLVVLNSMNIDTPALSEDLQTQTYDFINQVIMSLHPVEDRRHLTVLLTHIPLHKQAGVCVDPPFFSYWHSGAGIREQNHLSEGVSSSAILEGLFGLSGRADAAAGGRGRKGVILTGHDHEGCDVYHHIRIGTSSTASSENEESSGAVQSIPWNATRFTASQREGLTTDSSINGIREVTLRSMMGQYGGTAALMSAWWDESLQEWDYEVSMCAVGVQHIWWGIHISALVELSILLCAVTASLFELGHKQLDMRPVAEKSKKRPKGESGKKGKVTREQTTMPKEKNDK